MRTSTVFHAWERSSGATPCSQPFPLYAFTEPMKMSSGELRARALSDLRPVEDAAAGSTTHCRRFEENSIRRRLLCAYLFAWATVSKALCDRAPRFLTVGATPPLTSQRDLRAPDLEHDSRRSPGTIGSTFHSPGRRLSPKRNGFGPILAGYERNRLPSNLAHVSPAIRAAHPTRAAPALCSPCGPGHGSGPLQALFLRLTPPAPHHLGS